MQRHITNRTENKERRQAKQRNTTQKTKRDEGHGQHQEKKTTNKRPEQERDLVALASVAELCPENHYCTGHKP